jgi:hypothetical protein
MRNCDVRAEETNAESCSTTKTSDREPLTKVTHLYLPTPSLHILMYLFCSVPSESRQSFRCIEQQGSSVMVHFISSFLHVQFIVPRNNIPSADRLLRSPNDHYRFHKSPPLVPILSYIIPVHTFSAYFCRIRFNITLQSKPTPSKSSLLIGFPTKLCTYFHLSHVEHMPRPSHLHLFEHPDNNTRTMHSSSF